MPDAIGSIYVPNIGPKDAKIVLVGEAPGQEEVKQREPFVGESGNKLTTCLGRNGVSREEVLLANLCHYRPPRNDFRSVLGSTELSSGLAELYDHLRNHRPTVVCALGNWPLYYLTGKHGKSPGSGILNWRGSLLTSNVKGLEDLKVIPTVHPAAVLRDGSYYPVFDQDIKRVIQDSKFPELRLPKREYVIIRQGMGDLAEYWTERLLSAKRLAVDIETFGTDLGCVGFAPSPEVGVCFIWGSDLTIRDCVIRLLTSSVPKTFHFGTFDTEHLHSFSGIDVVNWDWDTMVVQHIMEPELPRSLAYLTSIYTREVFYKDAHKEGSEDIKSWGKKVNREMIWVRNCKDVCVTSEIQIAQEKELKEGPENWRDYFEFEHHMLGVASEISRTGMLIDEERRRALEIALLHELTERQGALNYAAYMVVNANSPKQVQRLVYDILKLPVRYNRKTKKRTTDEDALVGLLAFATDKMYEVKREETKNEWMRKALAVKLVMLVRQTRKSLSSYILPKRSADGRARGIYKVPGTDTGRWSAEKFLDGSGFNPQTTPREPLEVEEELWNKIIGAQEAQVDALVDKALLLGEEEESDDSEDSDTIDDSSPEGESAA